MTPAIPELRQQEIIGFCVAREAGARAAVDVCESSQSDEEGKEIEVAFAFGVNYAMLGFSRRPDDPSSPRATAFQMGFDACRNNKISALG